MAESLLHPSALVLPCGEDVDSGAWGGVHTLGAYLLVVLYSNHTEKRKEKPKSHGKKNLETIVDHEARSRRKSSYENFLFLFSSTLFLLGL